MNDRIEIWGGVECTMNRVGEQYNDQLARCGHYDRLDEDLDRIAAIGVTKLRYPALWERVAPESLATADWTWTDAVLAGLRRRGIEPIVGLVHHGSGPAFTSLLHPNFATGLGEYAAAFAARYPWVRSYTPVNEPLTTARFSALYGHWYPHCRSDRAFLTALVNQCRAIVLAMDAIRRVQPDALLVQTEDAGSTRSTRRPAEQAEFENRRRWLSIDFLTGRVTGEHPLWKYLAANVDQHDVAWFSEHPCTPDILGLNYYVTSDRFLDERLDRHHPASYGGNGKIRYADVEAARIPGVGIRGHAAVLEEAWHLYQLPLAITEAHLGCTREEQMRWLAAAWAGAEEAKRNGADVRAVTAWALLGSWDWDSLVTRPVGHYEPGAFDIRGGSARPTAIARLVRQIADGGAPSHALLQSPGWWELDAPQPKNASPILVTGATGTLGRAFARECARRNIPAVVLSRKDLDITDPDQVRAVIAMHRPWAVVNAAGYVRVDDAEQDARTCRRVNAVAPAILAAVCRKAGIRFLTFSSDLVFNGAHDRPYVESDVVSPLNIYGHTKAEAERRVLAFQPDALIVRTSAFFGPWDEYNFVAAALGALSHGQPFRAAHDTTVSPTYVPDLVNVSLDLLIDGASGLWHLANDGAITWADFAQRAARLAGLNPEHVLPCDSATFGLTASRPRYSALASAHGRLMPELDDSLERYFHERARLGSAA